MADHATRRVASAIVLLAVPAALLCRIAVDQAPYRGGGWHLDWLVLAGLSAAAELFVLHIQVRREAQAVSLSEIPQVVGLFLATPLTFLVGRLLGVLSVCVLHRRQAPLKLAYNGVQIALESAVAVLVFRAVLDVLGTGDPARWLAAFAATGVVGALSALSTTAIVALAEGTVDLRELLTETAHGVLASTTVAVPGLIVVGLVERSPWNAILAALAFGALAISYRTYGSLRERHLALERLYRFSQVVSARPEVDQVLHTMLGQACGVMRADRAEVLVLAGNDGDPSVRVSALSGGKLLRTEITLAADTPWARAAVVGEPVLIPRDSRDPAGRDFLAEQGLRDAIVVPLRGEAGLVGAMLVADRSGDVRTFARDDMRLLETVANHAAAALRNAQLIGQLRHEAAHDALTGLPNRTALRRYLQDLLAHRGGRRIAVMVLDLDGFKQVNESLGHHQGDMLLQQVARRLRAGAPAGSYVAHLGGDEFAVVIDSAREDAETVATGRALLGALAEPLQLEGLELEVSASLGIALVPEHADDVPGVLRRADMAMYQAKNTLRGVALFDAEASRPDTPAQLALVSELRRAIDSGEIRMFVQPKADAVTGAIVGVEALARWQHPTHGLIMPDEFIPIAERHGLIRALTAEMLRQAITAVSQWRRDGEKLSIAVNLSPRGVLDADLPNQVRTLLAGLNCPPTVLTLELTESSMMTDPAGVAALMNELHQTGIRLSIDDFGTGYSSLSSLRKLPLDEIKVDKSFVMGIEDNGDDEKIVRSIVDLGTNLGLDVVAEGVENARIWQMLRRMGCTHVQGYYLTRPIPSQDFTAWLVGYRSTHGLASVSA
jgi:diguanylate cyclase (GGDEF)-like protein